MTHRLSRRELEVARLVAEGLPDKTIADILRISSRTVQEYLVRIAKKIGAEYSQATRRGAITRYVEDFENAKAIALSA